MKIKSIIRHHVTPIRTAFVRKAKGKRIFADKYSEGKKCLSSVQDTVNQHNHYENRIVGHQKLYSILYILYILIITLLIYIYIKLRSIC